MHLLLKSNSAIEHNSSKFGQMLNTITPQSSSRTHIRISVSFGFPLMSPFFVWQMSVKNGQFFNSHFVTSKFSCKPVHLCWSIGFFFVFVCLLKYRYSYKCYWLKYAIFYIFSGIVTIIILACLFRFENASVKWSFFGLVIQKKYNIW